MNTFFLLAVFLVVSLVVQATLLWLAVRMCRLPKRSWGRARAISGVRLFAAVALWVAPVGRDGDPTMMPVFWVAVLVLDTVLTLWLVRRWFAGRLRAVVGAWALQSILGLVVGLGLTGLIQACLATYVIPSSSMNPNIRGYHVVELLPDGNHLIVAATDPTDPHGIPAGGPSRGIVAETYESREGPRPAGYTVQADRIVCNKAEFPERWDAVVFRYPRKTEIVYVKRLVGLPGESIVIRDGAVWVNGERQTPPERLGPIRYRGSFRDDGDDAGSEEVVLGPDEFFMLGTTRPGRRTRGTSVRSSAT